MSTFIPQSVCWSVWLLMWRWPSKFLACISGVRQWLPGGGREKTATEQDNGNCPDVSARQHDRVVTSSEEPAREGKFEHLVIAGKGEMISGGTSGLVERLPSGDVVKSPWPGLRAADCRRDLTTESKIYGKLGSHPRLVKIINWDSKDCVLTMDYMPNGCLDDYLRENNNKISTKQRLQWIREAAEGLQLLHSADVIHCDVEPKNFLLDTDLGLKIADFGGSSLEGSQPSACAGARFTSPDFNWRSPPTIQQDLYSFGSTIYNIMTGRAPFHDLPNDKVEELYKANKFPNVAGIVCGEIIERCWHCHVATAQEIYHLIQVIEEKLSCEIKIHCTFK